MERATISRIESWDARPVPGGYAGLSALEEDGFTGAVAAHGTHLFVLNGRVVGVFGGSLSAFEGAESTAYEAPDPALPLLFTMQERGGEVRGKYYTDDTPLREVDDTLSEGGFTGYLELSENVLSGDYYVVYYGGRSLAVAFVGNEGRVVAGQEAFELAADEVGIYEVRSVDVEVIKVPEPAGDEVTAAAGTPDAEKAPTSDDGPGGEPTGEHEPAEDEPVGADADDSADSGADEGTIPEAEAPREEPSAEAGIDESEESTAGADDAEPDDTPLVEDAESVSGAGGPEAGEAGTADTSDGPEDATSPARASEAGTGDAGGSGRAGAAGRSASAQAERSERPATSEDGAEDGDPDERFREEERWREARTVPALDPEESGLPRQEREEAGRAQAEPHEPAAERGEAGGSELEALRGRMDELESTLESTDRERRRQAERAEELSEERNELLEERETLESRIEELEARIEAQEGQLAEQPSGTAAGAPDRSTSSGGGANAIDPDDVLDQTDLFVRYGSKGKATLQTAHDGRADREEVAENLRLETHSRFDPAGATVSGRPFEEYLADTIEYRFVAWLVEELLYEIQETGSERSLRALYDVLPAIDRAEFDGTVTIVDEAGEETEEREEAFDVVCRDRMGKPLVVANINDSLDPATGEMMGALVEDATVAGEAHESLGAAFLVTASFFEPDALETASEATGGGFLSRDSKKSFVKLSRKGGYHLSLVEARGGEFHVAVPEF